MIPLETAYIITRAPNDFKRCRALMHKSGDVGEVGYPTVIAVRHGKLIGFLSTLPLDKAKAVVANKLIISKDIKRPVFVAWRLIETYEDFLRRVGLVHYWVPIDKHNAPMRKLFEEFLGKPFAEDEVHVWYERSLNGRR